MTYGLPDSLLYGSYKRIRGSMRSGRGAFSRAQSYISYDISFGGLILDPAKLDFMLNQQGGEVGRHMDAMARIITARAKAQVGRESGALMASIKWQYGRTSVGQERVIGSHLPYALAHHEGTAPRVIKPKNGQVLSFKSKGVSIVTDVVKHPGTEANRYLSDNLDVVVSSYLRLLSRG
jgi:hypothetical protein